MFTKVCGSIVDTSNSVFPTLEQLRNHLMQLAIANQQDIEKNSGFRIRVELQKRPKVCIDPPNCVYRSF